jgi:two-component sensor histidine kinase
VKYLLALLSLIAFTSQAEPLYLPLSQARVGSLKAKIWQSAPDTNRVNLLVQLSNDLIAKNYSRGEPLDSVTAYIHQAQALSKAIGFENGQIDSDFTAAYLVLSDKGGQARKLILSALARSQRQQDGAREALGWYLLGWTYENSPVQRPQRLRCFRRAAQLFHATHDLRREAISLKEVADVHLAMEKPVLARAELLHVLALYRACGYRQLQYTFDLLAATNNELGNYKEALRYALAAVQRAKSCQDTAALGDFYARVGGMYQQLNQLEKTVQYYQLVVRHAEQRQDIHTILDMTYAIAVDLIALKRPQQALALVQQKTQAFPAYDDFTRLAVAHSFTACYMALKQYKLADTWCKQLEMLSTTPTARSNVAMQQVVYYTIGCYYSVSQHYHQARNYLFQSLAIGKLYGNKAIMAHMCLLLYKADSAQGNLPSAIAYYKRYKVLNDSVSSERISKQIAGLQIQYGTEKKEQSIALLTKRNLVQQLIIRQRELQRNAVLGGSALLVLVLGLGYNRYRLKQRSTHLLEQKQFALEAQQVEINRKNEALEQVLEEKDQLLEERQGLLVEKDWMLKEIHHRVKNNLQVVSSLLATQSRHLRDSQAIAAIRESQNRVQVMALLHQKLYQADNIGRVNMADYGREIVTYLVQSFDRQHAVKTKLELAPVELETTLATPLGLIINEAVTNALKHAFPPPRRGTLTVRLVCLAPQQYQLTISDDGVGLPVGFDLTRSRSLGMVIIKGLSRQLDGQLAVTAADGVHLSLQFNTSKKPVYAEAGA